MKLHGAFIAAVPTPLDDRGQLDEAALDRYVAYMAAQPVSGVAVWVHTGRGLHLAQPLRRRLLQRWREGLGKGALVVAGAGGPGGEAMAHEAAEWGADAILAFPPVHLGPGATPAEIVAFHEKMAAAGLPVILFYLYREAGGIPYAPDVLRVLLSLPGVAGIKMATLRDVVTFQDVAAIADDFPKVTLVTGEDRFLGYSFMLGARAALVGLGAIFPAQQVELMRAFMAGRERAAEFVALAQHVDRLARAVFAPPVDGYVRRLLHVLAMSGVIPAGAVHDPWGPPLPPSDTLRLEQAVREFERAAGTVGGGAGAGGTAGSAAGNGGGGR